MKSNLWYLGAKSAPCLIFQTLDATSSLKVTHTDHTGFAVLAAWNWYGGTDHKTDLQKPAEHVREQRYLLLNELHSTVYQPLTYALKRFTNCHNIEFTAQPCGYGASVVRRDCGTIECGESEEGDTQSTIAAIFNLVWCAVGEAGTLIRSSEMRPGDGECPHIGFPAFYTPLARRPRFSSGLKHL